MIETIHDAADPRLEPYRDIRERDLKGRGNAFVAEGEVVLRLLAERAPQRLRSVLVAPARLDSLKDLIRHVPDVVPVYVAPLDIMSALAGFPIHRGVLAIGERPPDPGAAQLLASLPRRAIVLGLIGIANHDNVGGLFRNAAAFGVNAALLDRATCDPLYRKAVRVSVGAALAIPFARSESGPTIVAALENAGFHVLALSPRGKTDIRTVSRRDRTALLVGAEGHGLDATLMTRVETARIAMPGAIDSLNVATASAIALHHLSHGD